jgi:hypothetical protein
MLATSDDKAKAFTILAMPQSRLSMLNNLKNDFTPLRTLLACLLAVDSFLFALRRETDFNSRTPNRNQMSNQMGYNSFCIVRESKKSLILK